MKKICLKTTAFWMLLSACIFAFSCRSQHETIVGHIQGWGDALVGVEYYAFSGEEGRDTVYVKGGTFSYTPSFEGMGQLSFFRTTDLYPRQGGDFMPNAKRIDLIVFPHDRIRIKGRAGAGQVDYSASGTPLMRDMSRVRSRTLPYEVQNDSTEFELIAAMESNASMEEQEAFFFRRRNLNMEMRKVEREYIRAHPNREASALFVLQQPVDSFPAYYALLPEKVRDGSFKELLDSRKVQYEAFQIYSANLEKEFIGHPAPDFTLTDLSGKPFTLSAYEHEKYLVLDFWGSWCGPCLVGFPEMKRYYEKYRDKLEIIGIACRDKEEAWKQAVEENELPWIQLFNDESSADSSVSVLYAVDGFPTKALLSPDKTVLQIFSGEGPDFYQRLDELLQ